MDRPDEAGPGANDRSAMGLLMQVEVPLRVSLGRAKMRMKDLLGLTQGSVVELDQQVEDEVEIRVNKHLIAHGEVIGIDGNYGVRILRLANGMGLGNGGALPSLPESSEREV